MLEISFRWHPTHMWLRSKNILRVGIRCWSVHKFSSWKKKAFIKTEFNTELNLIISIIVCKLHKDINQILSSDFKCKFHVKLKSAFERACTPSIFRSAWLNWCRFEGMTKTLHFCKSLIMHTLPHSANLGYRNLVINKCQFLFKFLNEAFGIWNMAFSNQYSAAVAVDRLPGISEKKEIIVHHGNHRSLRYILRPCSIHVIQFLISHGAIIYLSLIN